MFSPEEQKLYKEHIVHFKDSSQIVHLEASNSKVALIKSRKNRPGALRIKVAA